MIIGLCGPAGAGKSTAAKLLAARYGLKVLPFAAPLKQMLAALGVPPRHLYGSPEDKAKPLELLGGKSARHAMQMLGTEWGRDCISPDLWANAWQVAAAECGNVIADDVRFTNEVQAIHKLRGTVLCVVRSLEQFHAAPSHASEAFQELGHDGLIINNGNLDYLDEKLAWRLDSAPMLKAYSV